MPGFFISRKGSGSGYWTLAGGEGILIPMRDSQERIVGFQIKNPDKKGYTWLSSPPDNYSGGTGSGTMPHVARPLEQRGDQVWITEGPLKADISTDRLGEIVVAVPGVGVTRGLIEVLRELAAHQVVVAFDADKRTKSHVG